MTTWESASPAFAAYPSLKHAVMVSISVSAAITVCGIIVGGMIWSGSPDGRKLAQKFLIARLIGMILTEIIAMVLMADLPKVVVTASINGLLGAVIREGIYFGVWWSYFKLSKRVKNTYGD